MIRVFDERWTGILTNREDPDEMPRNAARFFTVSQASRIIARPDDNSYVRTRALPVCDNGRLVYLKACHSSNISIQLTRTRTIFEVSETILKFLVPPEN